MLRHADETSGSVDEVDQTDVLGRAEKGQVCRQQTRCQKTL